ncbi:hypothetical protein ACFO7V_17905 [Glutamicibacter bergerei]|uniref:Integration host factor n=1 Tax=Glutamicibacter bergerei TaxID=256702 RepID=A0ABV9MSL1_9MICC|nr:hypothetical protein [Micrococcaceae bacterium]
MSKPRKSSAALAAREKARAKAEEITRRNEELIDLAAGFFVHEDQLAKIDEDTEQKIAELRAAAEQKKTTTQAKAMEVVSQMLGTGESKKALGERLGLSATELKNYLPAAPVAQEEKSTTGDIDDSSLKNSASTNSETEKTAPRNSVSSAAK